MKKALFISALMLASPVFAAETQDYCKLVNTQSEIRATTLGSPKAFLNYNTNNANNSSPGASIIQDGSREDVEIGISQSVSNHIQSRYIMEIATRECHLYGVNKALSDTLSNLSNKVTLLQLNAKRPILAQALQLADSSVNVEKKLFDTQNSTIADLALIHKIRDDISASITQNEQQYSLVKEIPPIYIDQNLKQLAEVAVDEEAKIAKLNAKIDATSGWDVAVSAGVKHGSTPGPVGGNIDRDGGFVSINVTISLGQVKAAYDSSRIYGLSKQYLTNKYDSSKNTYLRLTRAAQDILVSEKNNNANIHEQLSSVQELLNKVAPVDTTLAKRTERQLRIQKLVLEAELAASDVKVEEITLWLTTNKIN